MQELLQLPLQVQATLVAGYMGYALLKRDYRKSEKITDMWLLILLLGLPTALTLQLCDSNWAYLSVFFGLPLAYIWLKWVDSGLRDFLYKNKVSHTINSGDVWKTLATHKGVEATQISLINKDGKCYLCDSTSKFHGDVFAPFIMDDDGIAFYVTHTMGKEDTDWKVIDDVKMSPEYGSMLTYFPRADVHVLDIRYVK